MWVAVVKGGKERRPLTMPEARGAAGAGRASRGGEARGRGAVGNPERIPIRGVPRSREGEERSTKRVAAVGRGAGNDPMIEPCGPRLGTEVTTPLSWDSPPVNNLWVISLAKLRLFP